MIDVDKKEVKELIEWWKKREMKCLDATDYLIPPLMEALGDDLEEILTYLKDMEIEDLEIISGCFEEIYGKFMTDEVYDALGEIEEKINASRQ